MAPNYLNVSLASAVSSKAPVLSVSMELHANGHLYTSRSKATHRNLL